MSDFDEPTPRGTNWGKVALGCGLAALILIVLGIAGAWWWWSSSTTTDPAEIATLTGEIVPGATIPDGYQGAFGFQMFGVKMVVIHAAQGPASDGRLTIMLSSAPGGTGTAMLDQLREDRTGMNGTKGAKVEDVGRETVTVASQELQLQKSRLTPDDNPPFLQYTGSWRLGEDREIALIITGSEEGFDRAAMEAFLGSMKPAGK